MKNGKKRGRPVIDPHYKEKHPDISAALILDLAKGLDGKEFQVQERDGEWEFFMLDRIEEDLPNFPSYSRVSSLSTSISPCAPG